MQEFARICQEKDAQVVLSVLPLWPKVYAKLSIVSKSVWIYLPEFNVGYRFVDYNCRISVTHCCPLSDEN